MMKVGVVCEGPSDFPAIVQFLKAGLEVAGVETAFKPLFPEMDNTRPEGGWANVFSWLARYPAEARVQRFFAGGLFGGDLGSEQLDAIIIQLDTDVLGDVSFKNYVSAQFGITLLPMVEPKGRAQQIALVLATAGQFDSLADVDKARHIALPAVESTESWCVSAFSAQPIESNKLSGPALVTAFMRALEASESKVPRDFYINIDKSLYRRQKFCLKHRDGYNRIVRDCEIFSDVLSKIIKISG